MKEQEEVGRLGRGRSGEAGMRKYQEEEAEGRGE
jgi:hypothetical protein